MNKRLFFTFDKKVENNRLRGLKINFQAKKPNFQTFKSLKVEKNNHFRVIICRP